MTGQVLPQELADYITANYPDAVYLHVWETPQVGRVTAKVYHETGVTFIEWNPIDGAAVTKEIGSLFPRVPVIEVTP